MTADSCPTRANPAIRVRLASGFVLLVIACLALGGYLTVDLALRRAETSGSVINVAGRQRMLSQRIGKASLNLAAALDAADDARRARNHDALREALELWESSQRTLRTRPASESRELNLPEIEALYDAASVSFDASRASAHALLSGTDPTRPTTIPVANAHALADTVARETDAFLPIMNRIVNAYDLEAERQISTLRHLNFALTFGLFTALILAAIFVFEPTARRLRRQHEELLRQRDEVHRTRNEKDALLRELSALRGALEDHAILWIADGNGTIVDVNRGVCELSGYSRDELLNDSSLILNSGARPSSLGTNVWSTLEGGSAWRGLICNETRDGSVYWIDLTTIRQRTDDGTSDRFISVGFDITQQRIAEERLSLAIKSSHIGLWDWDVESGTTYFSDTFYTMLGYRTGAFPMTVESWKQLCHPDDLDRALNDIERHCTGEQESYHNEHRLRRADGSWMWIRDAGEVVERNLDGSPRRMIGAHIDIDASKRLDLALRSAIELTVHDSEAETITQLCRAVADVTGMSFVGICRRHAHDPDRATLIAGWDDDAAVESFEYDLAGTPCAEVFRDDHCVWTSDVSAAFPDDDILHRLGAEAYVGIRLHDSQGNVIGLLILINRTPMETIDEHDATVQLFATRAASELERVTIESSLRRARDAAEAASRAKSEFLANMSHEIRTPMTAILGYGDLLAEAAGVAPDAPIQSDYIDTIRRNGEHLLSIINDILDVSKIEVGKMEVESIPTSPAEIVNDVTRLMQVKAEEKRLELRARCLTPIPASITSDPIRLRQILVNLTGNAIKFTERGTVTIELAHDAETGMLHIDVIDTGIGITAAKIDALFNPFEQADSSTTRRYGGTGLGLHISHELSHLLGGDLSATSEPGTGSTFSLTVATGDVTSSAMLPAADALDRARERTTATAARNAPCCTLDGVRILFAEDGADNQRLIRHHLTRAGAIVTLVENGRLALDALTDGPSSDAPLLDPCPFDLLLTDMQMPEMDGYQLARVVRDRGGSVPIIALTAHAMSGDAEKCLAAGCDGYASKPVDRDALIRVCAEASRGASAST